MRTRLGKDYIIPGDVRDRALEVLGGREMPNPFAVTEKHPAYLPLARASLLEQVWMRPLDQGDALLDPLQINHAVRFESERRRVFPRPYEEQGLCTRIAFMGAFAVDPKTLDMQNLAARTLDAIAAAGASSEDQRTSVCFLSAGHWTTVAVQRGVVYFFDSIGGRPEAAVRAYMRSVARGLGTGHRPRRSVRRYQYGGTECGVYAIAFALGDNTFQSDADMAKARKTYFVSSQGEATSP